MTTTYKRPPSVTRSRAHDTLQNAPADAIDLPAFLHSLDDTDFLCGWSSCIADCLACGRYSTPTLIGAMNYVRDRFNTVHGIKTTSAQTNISKGLRLEAYTAPIKGNADRARKELLKQIRLEKRLAIAKGG